MSDTKIYQNHFQPRTFSRLNRIYPRNYKATRKKSKLKLASTFLFIIQQKHQQYLSSFKDKKCYTEQI
ncbi:Hypothetical predicted protein [Octopus vulgaris]|uniref:Uncharacterized protein n=1 Tax=Octopus vulgaris TaxID=6645 RepID=A0AA36BD98_OCTVU|nr:Hypothetical predicted protein [Octopus vulgaris]